MGKKNSKSPKIALALIVIYPKNNTNILLVKREWHGNNR